MNYKTFADISREPLGRHVPAGGFNSYNVDDFRTGCLVRIATALERIATSLELLDPVERAKRQRAAECEVLWREIDAICLSRAALPCLSETNVRRLSRCICDHIIDTTDTGLALGVEELRRSIETARVIPLRDIPLPPPGKFKWSDAVRKAIEEAEVA